MATGVNAYPENRDMELAELRRQRRTYAQQLQQLDHPSGNAQAAIARVVAMQITQVDARIEQLAKDSRTASGDTTLGTRLNATA